MVAIALSACSVRKSFGALEVLRDVNISLPVGSVTALMGRSGSGKTTLLRALAFIDPPDEGSIVFEGQEYCYPSTIRDTRHLWPNITVVFQDLFLWPHLTCRRNITLPAVRRGGERGTERAAEIAAQLRITQLLESYPNEISRGQRQLVALARAIAVSSHVLLLDEITASLDVETSARVVDVLEAERARGAAIMLITHQFGFARDVADYVAYLHDGSIVEQGPSSILSRPETEILSNFVRLARIAP